MTTYALKFEAELPGVVDACETAFYEHFDGLISESYGRLLITVYMDGHENGVSAAKCAAMELRDKLDVAVRHTDRDLVDASEISRRTDRSRESVRQLINGVRRRGTPFPKPVGAPNGKRLWEWGVVNEWLRLNVPEIADPELYLSRDDMTVVDGWLLRWNTLPRDQHVRSEFLEITASVSTHRELHRRPRPESEAWVSSWNVREQLVQTESLSSSTSSRG
ncbi:hypothetical protein ACFZCU_11140 [Streptomyces canus]|uniref:hypothetical protein n=1 Tax=Streptomyces canus TaxID=58343 RepID=UPI0036ECB252